MVGGLEIQALIDRPYFFRLDAQVSSGNATIRVREDRTEFDKCHLRVCARHLDYVFSKTFSVAVARIVLDVKPVLYFILFQAHIDPLTGIDGSEPAEEYWLRELRTLQRFIAILNMLAQVAVHLDDAPLSRLLFNEVELICIQDLVPSTYRKAMKKRSLLKTSWTIRK